MRCEKCDGTGWVTGVNENPLSNCRDRLRPQQIPCPACEGNGIQSCCEGMCGDFDDPETIEEDEE